LKPPACPELNSAENIWQYLRQTYLPNRVFKDYTDILDACQDAWRKLLAKPAASPQSHNAIGSPSVNHTEGW
jgi:hypothetical protein